MDKIINRKYLKRLIIAELAGFPIFVIVMYLIEWAIGGNPGSIVSFLIKGLFTYTLILITLTILHYKTNKKTLKFLNSETFSSLKDLGFTLDDNFSLSGKFEGFAIEIKNPDINERLKYLSVVLHFSDNDISRTNIPEAITFQQKKYSIRSKNNSIRVVIPVKEFSTEVVGELVTVSKQSGLENS